MVLWNPLDLGLESVDEDPAQSGGSVRKNTTAMYNTLSSLDVTSKRLIQFWVSLFDSLNTLIRKLLGSKLLKQEVSLNLMLFSCYWAARGMMDLLQTKKR